MLYYSTNFQENIYLYWFFVKFKFALILFLSLISLLITFSVISLHIFFKMNDKINVKKKAAKWYTILYLNSNNYFLDIVAPSFDFLPNQIPIIKTGILVIAISIFLYSDGLLYLLFFYFFLYTLDHLFKN